MRKFPISNFSFVSLRVGKFPNSNKFKLYLSLVVIIFTAIIPLLDLLHAGLPVTHDGQDHVARIANFYLSLSEGNIIPRWAANLNWGYGHPILMFLYPLPSYSTSIIHLLGFTFVDSVKLVFAVAFILSGITMFLWMRNILGSFSGIISAMLYMFAPYRFVDLYVRGAIGEHVAFIFPPLLFYFLHKLSRKYSYFNFVGASFSFTALLLSHNAISIMFIPYIGLYSIYLIWINKNRIRLFSQFLLIFILGFGLSSFFIIPAFFEGKYTLRDIVTGNEYTSRFIHIEDLLYGVWNYGGTGQFTVQLGLLHIVGILFSVFAVYKYKKQFNKLIIIYFFTFLYFLFSIFIMLPNSNFIWNLFTTLQKFQFPWRFLTISVFASSVLGAFSIYIVPQNYKKVTLLIIILGIFLVNKNYWHANKYVTKPESFYKNIYLGTTDTGESSPIWSVRFMENKPVSAAEVIGGSAKINNISRTSTEHIYEIHAVSDSVRIRENTLYFPGWKVFSDGRELPIQFQDPKNRGVMTYNVDKGNHIVHIVFEETKMRKLANWISGISLVILIVTYVLFRSKYRYIYE